MSNLGAIADRFFGGVVGAGVDDAFGDGGRRRGFDNDGGMEDDGDGDGSSSFEMKGMRKRKVEKLDNVSASGGKSKSKKKGGPKKNTYQKSLYGR